MTAAAQATILHVDMDAFFAAVEVLDDPTLANKPVIVGGDGSRGVVASCTYEARAFGVHSAMSSVEARRRCPQAVFVPGRYWRYAETSAQLLELFRSFTPLVEPISLDEAFLDVAGAVRLLGAPDRIAWALRRKVADELGLACSVGVAPTKMLAKLASEAAKPIAERTGPRPGRGVVVVEPGRELEFLHPLPVRALWGVGPATAKRLDALGVVSVGELAAVPEDTLCRALGQAHGRHLARLARGEDDRVVVPEHEAKSVGHEETFARDLHSHADLHGHVVRMADAVANRLREAGVQARTVTLKVRFGDRATITRSQSVASPTTSARVLRVIAAALLDAVEVGQGVRLLGVSVSGLSRDTGAVQLSFDDDDGGAEAQPPDPGEPRWEEVEAAVGAVRARYGQGAVAPAALVGRHGLSVKRRGDTQWGPSDR
ncbi:MAG: DNA polymerase IV [Acidimicrobiales bacterium]